MKKQYTDDIMKLAEPTEKKHLRSSFWLKVHLENKKYKMTTRENSIKILGIMPL